MLFNPNGSKWLQSTQDLFVLDIPSLERRWLKYKIKSYLPRPILSITITIAIIIVVSVLFISSKSDLKTIEESKTSIPPKYSKKNIQENDIILEPSMEFIQSIAPDIQQPQVDDIQQPQTINAPIKTSQVKVEAKSKAPTFTPIQTVISSTPSTPIVSPPSIASSKAPTIKRDTDTFDIHEIEERFKTNSNPHLGLYIARYHYEHGNYSEAYNYALKTNSINSTMEESWLIFSKSLVKLGKSDQAKKTLQLYISQSNSENAKSLLNSIEQGGVK